jgi:hypothetical protein
MKRQILKVLVVGFLALASCSNNDLGRAAVITGFDARKCACCCGLMINFEGNTLPYTGDFYLIDNSGDLGLPNNATFPIYATVSYTLLSNTCNKHIHINSFRRIK